jgi:hypothetical protein
MHFTGMCRDNADFLIYGASNGNLRNTSAAKDVEAVTADRIPEEHFFTFGLPTVLERDRLCPRRRKCAFARAPPCVRIYPLPSPRLSVCMSACNSFSHFPVLLKIGRCASPNNNTLIIYWRQKHFEQNL